MPTTTRHAAAAPRGPRPGPDRAVRRWFERAEREAPLAEAMTLATVDADGAPGRSHGPAEGRSAPTGFRFFTNHESAKADQLGGGRGGAGALLARARPPGAGAGAGRAAPRRRVRRVLRHPPARLAARRLGLAPVAAARLARRARPARSPRPRRGSTAARSRGPPHWGGYLLRPGRSSSGRARSGACTTASATRRDGDGWRIERLAP